MGKKKTIENIKANPTQSFHMRFTEKNAPAIVGMICDLMGDHRSFNNALEYLLLQELERRKEGAGPA